MKEHAHVLHLAARGELPETVDSASYPPAAVVQELIEAGYLKATDVSSHDGAAYLNPKITLAGREYFARLEERPEGKRMKAKKRKDRPWLEIEREYDISKRSLGKKINFVKDGFKREVIFRDIEQAFLLAHLGFYKPSVVLAVGVIEEVLRLYLEHRNVVPANNNLDSYIKACQNKGLLKSGIQTLADSVRQFRNIVHLERESSSKYSVSKATAKGAVSAVFTIVNDLGT